MAQRTALVPLLLFALARTASADNFYLAPQNMVAIGTGCYDVKSADLNGDGLADAVTASNDTQRIAVMLSTASGLGAPTYYPGGQAVAIDLADFDGNGSVDILEADYNEHSVRLLLNPGNGTFSVAGSFNVPGSARDVASADFNGDGKRDAVVALGNGSVAYLQGTGGGFGSAASVSVGISLKGIAAGDLDNDGDPDVVAVDATSDQMFRLRNDGGAFPFPVQSVTGFTGSPSDVALADFNGDGYLDAAVSQENNVVAVVVGGAGGYGPNGFTYAIGPQSQSVQVADFDQEDGPDILVSSYGLNLVQVLRNRGNFVFGGTVQAQTSSNPRAAAPGDFDGDGRVDVVSGDFNGGFAKLFLNRHGDPHLAYSPASVEFGAGYQGIPTSRQVLLQNTGTATLTVTPGAIDGSEFIYDGPNPRVDIQPGDGAYIVVKCKRTLIGEATGTLHFTTTDPVAAEVAVALHASTGPAYPNVHANPTALDFGTKSTGVTQVLSFQVSNDGVGPLDVTPGSVDGGQFEYASSSAPFQVPVGGSATVSIRYLRSADGAASGTVHLATNDPDTPEIQVQLDGFAGPPPVAGFSSPAPVTVSAGSSAVVPVIVRNLGISPLHINVPPAAGDLTEESPYDLGPTSQPFMRMDLSGAMWNLDWEGRVMTGANNEYAGGMDESNFLAQAGGIIGLGGKELRLGPVAVAPGINVSRKIYVPGTGKWIRYVDVAENPNDTQRTATFELVDNLGSAPAGAILTSDGDAQFELSDDWIVVPAIAPARSVGRVFRSASASNLPVLATWAAFPTAFSRTRFVTTLAPHARACVIQWAVQGDDASDAASIVEGLRLNPAGGLQFTDAIDRATTWNLPGAANPFRPVAGAHTIAPGDSVQVLVTYGAEAATHDADLGAILRIGTDDPNNPALLVPLAFSVGGGQVVGAEPPMPSPATLALAGFRPNPTRLSGTARVAFRLATNEPATLTLYDVRGRTLARHSIESPSPGPGSLVLTRASLAPGVVWMRLEQGSNVVTGKGIVLP